MNKVTDKFYYTASLFFQFVHTAGNEVPTELTIKMALRRNLGVPKCNYVTRMPLTTIALLCKKEPSITSALNNGAICRVLTVYYLFLIVR